ncbi:MAG: hypothetical protein OEY18_04805 [Candidatus Aminicenantes bacterium]|nr:hypothetical protein [Candidatus Aminicenantes bacterium]MDH5384009.1 hypothetical protein [Candidatus Aminicenantes bacterium]MDH5744842.1 hypothetical protein [Candidatus Aminicenantes bacterium]
MKIYHCLFLSFWLCAVLTAETVYLGNNIYYDDEGPINLAADVRIAIRNLDSPYVMFMLYMTGDKNVSANIGRNNVVLVYKDKEYKMPNLSDLRKNYHATARDMELYWRLGMENLSFSEIRHYYFNLTGDFFPAQQTGDLPRDQGSVSGNFGFRTNVYFKNPGFKAGDVVVIKVWDEKNPEIKGEVTVPL